MGPVSQKLSELRPFLWVKLRPNCKSINLSNLKISLTFGDLEPIFFLMWSQFIFLIARYGKSHKHASIDCRQFLRTLWIFLDNHNFLAVLTHQCPKLWNWKFSMLRNYVNLQTFFNPKNWLADENLLFPYLHMAYTMFKVKKTT